ncbi:MAG: hypothetical protein ABSG72_01435 [Candidatus Sulfotelmatobacter sp.]|jgi:hypothetical protein
MCQRAVRLSLFCLILAPLSLRAQNFKIDGREVQIHGFASQGFVHTDDNNWLTMQTSNFGSGEFTDFGVNASMQVTDKFRIGAQLYDRNLGGLGKWYPQLDWAYAQYKLKPWLGFRGGRVKTVLGLYTDTQDLDFLHPYALLPQSIYPIDLRDATLAHDGGDVFGDISLGAKYGKLSYTAYGGYHEQGAHGGYAYLLESDHLTFGSIGGVQYGADLRWQAPLKGLLIGASRENQNSTSSYTVNLPSGPIPIRASDNADWINQVYGEYSWKKLLIDAEFRRAWDDNGVKNVSEFQVNLHAWYVGGAYRIVKRVQLASYYSRYWIGFPLSDVEPAGTGHINDKVVTGRIDINRFFNLKIEGHFMAGVGLPGDYPDGFYLVNNPQGLNPNTNALVVKGGFNF